MKFRNIITLLFMVTTFSSTYSMNDPIVRPNGGYVRSSLSQEFNWDSLNDISSDSSSDSFGDSTDQSITVSQEDLIKYEEFESQINELNILCKKALESYPEDKSIYSQEEFKKFINEEHSKLLYQHSFIDKLRVVILAELPQELSRELIIFLRSVELEFYKALILYPFMV